MCFTKEVNVETNFLIFFYLLSLPLFLIVLIMGLFLQPQKHKPLSLEQIQTYITLEGKSFKKAFKEFYRVFRIAPSQQQTLWFEIIGAFADSSKLTPKEMKKFEKTLKRNNPNFSEQITSIFNTTPKGRQ